MAEPVFTGINHVCIVTADLDRAVRTWCDRYGVGPWQVYTYAPEMTEVRVEGRPVEFGMRVGVAHLDASTRVELIQPLDDRSPYASSLAERGGADRVHHLRLDVADHAAALGRLEGLGLREVLSARFPGKNPAAPASATYMDTAADLGFIVEVAALPPEFAPPDPDYTYSESEPAHAR